MRHVDDETLAMLALGEPVDADVTAHLDACPMCASEVAALLHVADRVRDAGDVELVSPPTHVWEAIQAEVAADQRDQAVPLTLAEARERKARREPRVLVKPWIVAAAAAAGLVVGGVGVGALLSVTGDDAPGTVVAQAPLADLATEADAGEARVERRADGSEVLVLDTPRPDAGDGNLEVWLIDPEVVGMVSLGFLTGDHQEFEIPAGYAVSDFPIVDISVEPSDGDPTHSGDSVTRGVLG